MKDLQEVEVYEMGTKVIDVNQNTFTDEETGYIIYIAEDGHWIAEDYDEGFVQIK